MLIVKGIVDSRSRMDVKRRTGEPILGRDGSVLVKITYRVVDADDPSKYDLVVEMASADALKLNEVIPLGKTGEIVEIPVSVRANPVGNKIYVELSRVGSDSMANYGTEF